MNWSIKTNEWKTECGMKSWNEMELAAKKDLLLEQPICGWWKRQDEWLMKQLMMK